MFVRCLRWFAWLLCFSDIKNEVTCANSNNNTLTPLSLTSSLQSFKSKLFDTVEVFRSKNDPLLESNKAKVGSFKVSVLMK